jgi:hypothetical protein
MGSQNSIPAKLNNRDTANKGKTETASPNLGKASNEKLVKESGLFTLLREKSTLLSKDTSFVEDITPPSKAPTLPPLINCNLVKISIYWKSKQNDNCPVLLAGTFNSWATDQPMKKADPSIPLYTKNLVQSSIGISTRNV